MSSRIRWSIAALAVIGLGLSIAALRVHYRLLTDPSYVSPCDINATFNCSAAYLSRYGSLAGVPTALAGVLWFGVVGLVALAAKPTDGESVEATYLFALVLLAAPVVLFLGYASYVSLRVGCPICMGTYACVLAILLLTSGTKGVAIRQLPARLAGDLGGLKRRPMLFAILMVFLGGVGATAVWFPREGEAPPPAPMASIAPDIQAQFTATWNSQPRVDLGVAADGAKVLIVKFNDYECSACRAAEGYYSPVLRQLSQEHPGAVKVVFKDWPWSTACNKGIPNTLQGHDAACVAAAAARLARDRGKYDEMAAWLFEHQGVTEDEVRKSAMKILGIQDFDREAATTLAAIQRDVAEGVKLGIQATPTYFINGVRLDRMLSPEFFRLAIDIELKRAG